MTNRNKTIQTHNPICKSRSDFLFVSTIANDHTFNYFTYIRATQKSKNMNGSKIIAAILIIISLGLGYVGINKIKENTNEVKVLGLKIEASNESAKQEGYMYLGLAVLLLGGGLYSLNKSK